MHLEADSRTVISFESVIMKGRGLEDGRATAEIKADLQKSVLTVLFLGLNLLRTFEIGVVFAVLGARSFASLTLEDSVVLPNLESEA